MEAVCPFFRNSQTARVFVRDKSCFPQLILTASDSGVLESARRWGPSLVLSHPSFRALSSPWRKALSGSWVSGPRVVCAVAPSAVEHSYDLGVFSQSFQTFCPVQRGWAGDCETRFHIGKHSRNITCSGSVGLSRLRMTTPDIMVGLLSGQRCWRRLEGGGIFVVP